MRILIDGKNLSLKTGTGVATYARNVCQVARSSGNHVDVLFGERFGHHEKALFRELDFFDAEKPDLVGRLQNTTNYLFSGRRAKPFPIPLDGMVISRQFASRLPSVDGLWNANRLFTRADIAFAQRSRFWQRFNAVANVTRSDIAHWTYPIPLQLDGAANIYTIHDLVPLRLPFTTLDRKRNYYRLVERIAKNADRIVTVSETSKRDILSFFDIPEEKVVNTYQSVDIPQAMLQIDRRQLDEELFGLHRVRYKEYLLFYGAIEPKKNIGRLLEAYMGSGITMPLLVVGKDGWLSERELYLIDQAANWVPVPGAYGIKEARIRRVEYVSFPHLVNLIRGARLVAAPSLYEGFGLPVIEAMLCGTPVLTSNVGASAEVAGDAAVLVDPYNTRDIRDGLIRLSSDDELCREMVERGHRRTAFFSPERHYEALGAVYDAVARK